MEHKSDMKKVMNIVSEMNSKIDVIISIVDDFKLEIKNIDERVSKLEAKDNITTTNKNVLATDMKHLIETFSSGLAQLYSKTLGYSEIQIDGNVIALNPSDAVVANLETTESKSIETFYEIQHPIEISQEIIEIPVVEPAIAEENIEQLLNETILEIPIDEVKAPDNVKNIFTTSEKSNFTSPDSIFNLIEKFKILAKTLPTQEKAKFFIFYIKKKIFKFFMVSNTIERHEKC
jgi:hypothetical protein